MLLILCYDDHSYHFMTLMEVILDFKGVKEVAEVSGDKTANKYLKAGWIVLAVGTMTTDSREYAGPVIKYSLGWTGEGAAPHPSAF